MGWVPAARGRDDLSRGFVFGAVRLPMPMAAEVRVRVGVRAPKRPSAALLLRAGAKLTETTAKRLAILGDARKSKRRRESSLSELHPPALEPRDG